VRTAPSTHSFATLRRAPPRCRAPCKVLSPALPPQSTPDRKNHRAPPPAFFPSRSARKPPGRRLSCHSSRRIFRLRLLRRVRRVPLRFPMGRFRLLLFGFAIRMSVPVVLRVQRCQRAAQFPQLLFGRLDFLPEFAGQFIAPAQE